MTNNISKPTLNINQFPSGWYAILHLSEIHQNKPLGITRLGLSLVVWKSSNDIIIMDDSCPHRSAKLSLGKICDNKIRCPFHGFEFSANGDCSYAPEFKKAIPKLIAKKYQTKIALDMIWIMLGDVNTDIDILPLQAIYTQFNGKYTFFKKTWNSHISRCIENQLDYTHLTQVHKTTIGRGFVVPENPKFVQTENTILIYKDENSYSALSSYIFPNSWILNISDKMKIIAYFAPIDSKQTVLYIVTFRCFLNSLFIKSIVDYIVNTGNRIILKQDQQVVESQRSISDHDNELLMKHDTAIRMFRKMWKSYLIA
jgi:phenylpropionate dioxygenase-like ring-hydroxylating dioxygenase large terminal subunit